MEDITIQGARTHNLKAIDLTLPRNKLVVITGLSGSGKSSLAFDTLYAEGQRRYVESLSSYARQFLSVMGKPDVDHISGLSPAISIEQKSTSHNPRSTVGTVTEIYDYLRLLFARIGTPHCPTHHLPLNAQTIPQMVDMTMGLSDELRLMLVSPIVRNRKGEHLKLFEELKAKGFLRVRVDGTTYEIDALPDINPKQHHDIDVVVDRFKVRDDIRVRLSESLETALDLSGGLAMIIDMKSEEALLHFSANYACPECGFAIAELEPRLFSFNNPEGACPTCDGLGVNQYFDPDRVVAEPSLPLSNGAIRGWDKNSSYYFSMIESLGRHYKFDPDTPFEKLPKKIQQILLYGSGEEEIEFHYISNRGQKSIRIHPFEGILNNLERRYHETDSQIVRESLTRFLAMRVCPDCEGSRLGPAAKNVLIEDKAIHQITALPIEEALDWSKNVSLKGAKKEIADKIFKEIQERLGFLVNVGLDYLNLSRSAETLSGGEAQRIRLASQIGAGLMGVLYVLDEPSIGLHQRDNDRLLQTLFHLRDLGNTVIVVEHDEDAILSADYIVDIGPGAGVHGGQVVAAGTPKEILKNKDSLTADYLSGRKTIDVPEKRTKNDPKKQIKLVGATGNNLKNITASFPLGLLTCVTGVSGSGKSTLVNDTLYSAMARILNQNNSVEVAPYKKIEGLDLIDKIVNIDQSPIGRTPRSNPATYTGLFTPIREIFANTPEARARGYQPGRFSFNVKGGRCENCQGDGVIKVEMHFLPDVYVVCDECKGKRYNRETLDILYKGKSINDVLNMTVEEAYHFFDAIPVVHRRLETLMEVGLSYITLGQNATTLSGGEAQRVKLSRELSKRDTGKTVYILDEPTTGLHFHDIAQLLKVIHTLRDKGNTIIIIEHNLDVIKTADWIIDIGPEGGAKGGEILIADTPEKVAECKASYTGRYLKLLLEKNR
ncbi:excinuclease ABC subunit UvrA [Ignatzschineria larvae DSM 13226]|uniref:UvrABC system protein A n=1 Tax=Ignatzschineria larvae DSM 13226 TaxID=1111732 RepID=A0ABZ3C0R9_9GAMM|nr:excinuclease ABC subunit UvrA [Ignatzschineria larvae]